MYDVSGVQKNHPRVMIFPERYPRAKLVEYTTLSLVYSYSKKNQ